MSSKRFERLNRIEAKRKLLLSGTPIQNNLSELLCLLHFMCPEVFNYTDGILTTFNEMDGSLSRIKQMLNPFILRRLKKDVVLQLPQKREELIKVSLTAEQALIYQSLIERLVAAHQARNQGKKKEAKLTGKDATSHFTDLRKAANHPLLLRRFFDEEKLDEIAPHLHRRGAFGEPSEVRLDQVRACSEPKLKP